MLLSYRGPSSGREYTFPVRYFAEDGGVVSFSRADWWRQLADGAPVRLLLRGRWLEAVPAVSHDADVAGRLARFVERHGTGAARSLLVGLPGDRPPTPAELARAAERTVVVDFRISPAEPAQ